MFCHIEMKSQVKMEIKLHFMSSQPQNNWKVE